MIGSWYAPSQGRHEQSAERIRHALLAGSERHLALLDEYTTLTNDEDRAAFVTVLILTLAAEHSRRQDAEEGGR